MDPTFNGFISSNNSISEIALQYDGKILCVGWFTSVNSVVRNRIARLNSGGSIDTTFDHCYFVNFHDTAPFN